MELEDHEFKYVCKFCTKSFPCGRSLGGHMRSHLTNNSAEAVEKLIVARVKLSSANNNVNSDSWTCAKRKLVMMDSQSNNETITNASNRRRRPRRRRRTRYMGTTTSSSDSSIANATTTTSSVNEIEQEQEEVAMCLMMLSRDVGGHWGGLKFVAHESSDNNSVFSDSPSSVRTSRVDADIKGKISVSNGTETSKPKKKLKRKTSVVGNFDSLTSDGRQSQKKNEELYAGGFSKNDKLVKKTEFPQAQLSSHQKRSKFECPTCNKVFRSYQALGGHRASHKKIKGCFASKTDGRNTIETDLSPDPTSDSKLGKSCNNGNPIEVDIAASASHDVIAEIISTKSKGHACPICLRVFPSGQALGGHKRSHLIGGSAAETKTSQTLVIQKPPPQVRDFLDLNLPAPGEEESNGSHGGFL